MRKTLLGAAVAAALTLVGGAAYAADCFTQIMTKTESMIADAEKRGDMTNAAEARKHAAEAQRMYEQGQRDAALVRVVRGMILVDRTQSGGQ